MRLIAMVLLMLISVVGAAQEKKNKNAKYDLAVSGNCDMCKKRIEKAAFGVAGVKSAVWHSDDQVLHLILNEEKSSLTDVQKAIAKAGHDTEDVKASDADYEKLHQCCQYERKP